MEKVCIIRQLVISVWWSHYLLLLIMTRRRGWWPKLRNCRCSRLLSFSRPRSPPKLLVIAVAGGPLWPVERFAAVAGAAWAEAEPPWPVERFAAVARAAWAEAEPPKLAAPWLAEHFVAWAVVEAFAFGQPTAYRLLARGARGRTAVWFGNCSYLFGFLIWFFN